MLRIFLPLYLILFFYVLLYDPLTELVLYAVAEEEVMEDAIGDFQGAFYLIEEVLKNSDETAWPEHLENILQLRRMCRGACAKGQGSSFVP